MLALSDIEGEFENFRALLIAGHMMDSLYHWTFGKGHLVICGDLFDRGRDVVAELWLLYKLEDGQLPNHEPLRRPALRPAKIFRSR